MSLGVRPDTRITTGSDESEWASLTGHDVLIGWRHGSFRSFNGRLQVETLNNFALIHAGIITSYTVVGPHHIVSMNPHDTRLTAMIHETDKCAKCAAFIQYEEEEK